MSRYLIVACTVFTTWATSVSHAHEMRPAYLEVRETAEDTFDVFWKVPAQGTDARLRLNARFGDDVQFLTEPQGSFLADAHVQRMRIARAGGLAGTPITIDGLSGTFTDTLLRIEWLDGAQVTHRLTADAPTYVVAANPGMGHVAWTYFVLGVEHILFGIDHLLFVLALLLIVGDWRKLVGTITAFTVAHSITLALATLGWVHVPGPPVEAIIALSIVFVATEIVRGRQGHPGLTARSPWIVAFTFGLLHGFGFAGALNDVGLPQHAIPAALLTFNLGVEFGQLVFVAGMLACHLVARALRIESHAWTYRVAAYAIGGMAAFWMIERTVGFWNWNV